MLDELCRFSNLKSVTFTGIIELNKRPTVIGDIFHDVGFREPETEENLPDGPPLNSTVTCQASCLASINEMLSELKERLVFQDVEWRRKWYPESSRENSEDIEASEVEDIGSSEESDDMEE